MINTPSQPEDAETPLRQVVCALIVQDGKLLMVQNIKKGVRIEPPGGKVHTDTGETQQQAVIRECQEELGIDIEIIEHLTVAHIHTPEGEFDNHMFLCRIVAGEPAIPEAEAKKLSGFQWYSFEEIASNPQIVPEVPEIVEMLKEKSEK